MHWYRIHKLFLTSADLHFESSHSKNSLGLTLIKDSILGFDAIKMQCQMSFYEMEPSKFNNS